MKNQRIIDNYIYLVTCAFMTDTLIIHNWEPNLDFSTTVAISKSLSDSVTPVFFTIL